MEKPELKVNLIKAVISVMKEVRGMEKNSKVGTGSSAYDGTKDQDVKEAFNKALADNGLCILPIDIEESTQVDRWEEKTQYGTKQKQSVFTKAVTKYLLMHESGESQIIVGYGHGVDSQDKSAGKATTYALKNALLYTFLTPVGKIDDTDITHSNDLPQKPVQPKETNQKPEQQKQPEKKQEPAKEKVYTKQQVDEMVPRAICEINDCKTLKDLLAIKEKTPKQVEENLLFIKAAKLKQEEIVKAKKESEAKK